MILPPLSLPLAGGDESFLKETLSNSPLKRGGIAKQ